MKSWLIRFGLCLLPLCAGVGGAFYLRSSGLAGSLVQVRIELEWAAVGAGLVCSVLLLGYWACTAWMRRRQALAEREVRAGMRLEHFRFMQRLDHELKNPLTTLRANLENLRSAEPSAAALQSIDGVDRQALRLVRLTDDLRKLAAFEDAELTLESVDVASLFAGLQTTCAEHSAFAERSLVLALPAAPWPVRDIDADGDLLELALFNLLENAAKYSNPGDTIELRAAESTEHVRLTVADTGIGISKEEQQQIFDELFRGRNARGRLGSGIGLTLVERIVERHGWQIEVSSEEGRGTQVTLLVPV